MMVNELNSIMELPYEQAKKVLNALHDDSIVSITDKNNTVTYTSKKFCKLSKYVLSELFDNYFIRSESNYVIQLSKIGGRNNAI